MSHPITIRSGAELPVRRGQGFAFLGCGWAAMAALVCVCHVAWPQEQSRYDNRPIVINSNQPPDANTMMREQDRRQHNLSFDAANAARKRQITEEAQILLRLATEVKNEVDSGDLGLRPYTRRKTELIERLARDVQDKMKLTVPAH